MSQTNRTSWLAGFMDGEGSFYVARTTTVRRGVRYLSYRPRVSAVNTHESTMALVTELLSAYGAVHVSVKSEQDRRKRRYQSELTSWESCLSACLGLSDHLVTKQEQALLLADWCTHRVRLFDVDGRFRVGFSEQDHKWYEQLRRLNARAGSEYV